MCGIAGILYKERNGQQREIGQAQAWYYPADHLLVLWECFLEDPFRQDEPTADELLRPEREAG